MKWKARKWINIKKEEEIPCLEMEKLRSERSTFAR